MKRISIITILLIILAGCTFNEENKQLDSLTARLSKKYDCKIFFKNETGSNGENVTLDINKPKTEKFFIGKIVLDFYSQTKELNFERFTVFVDGKHYYDLTNDDLIDIEATKTNFDSHSNLLIAKDYERFYSLIDDKLKNEIQFEDFIKNFGKLVKSEYDEFDGFNVVIHENELYYIFVRYSGNHYVTLTYKKGDVTHSIYGIVIE